MLPSPCPASTMSAGTASTLSSSATINTITANITTRALPVGLATTRVTQWRMGYVLRSKSYLFVGGWTAERALTLGAMMRRGWSGRMCRSTMRCLGLSRDSVRFFIWVCIYLDLKVLLTVYLRPLGYCHVTGNLTCLFLSLQLQATVCPCASPLSLAIDEGGERSDTLITYLYSLTCAPIIHRPRCPHTTRAAFCCLTSTVRASRPRFISFKSNHRRGLSTPGRHDSSGLLISCIPFRPGVDERIGLYSDCIGSDSILESNRYQSLNRQQNIFLSNSDDKT